MTSPRKSRDPKTLRPATQLIHGGTLRSQFEETSEALFLTQGYLYDTMELAEARFKGDDPGFIYSRFANPTVVDVRAAHGAVRGRGSGARDGERHGGGHRSRSWASSRPATTWSPRRRCSAPAAMSSRIYLPRFGVASTLVDGTDLDAWRAAMRPNTKTVRSSKSPTNPTLEVIDIAAVAEIAHAAGATLVVDNVFATPLLPAAR